MGAGDGRKGAIKNGVQFAGRKLQLMEVPFTEKEDPRRSITRVGGVGLRCCPLWARYSHCTHGTVKRMKHIMSK